MRSPTIYYKLRHIPPLKDIGVSGFLEFLLLVLCINPNSRQDSLTGPHRVKRTHELEKTTLEISDYRVLQGL